MLWEDRKDTLKEPTTAAPALDFLSVITELKDENTRLNSKLEEAQAKIRWYWSMSEKYIPAATARNMTSKQRMKPC
ncbi:MAG: hypothetical protein PWR12_1431 [Eubacteriaceae bacterium]|jgi:hypothetical protein|nr:hypothetical protein [Eubacteriaceae bacterium]MDK2905355.1 hypothetical protein [Eubacteriaceae bacterium]MDK2935876.1 hypothetical protein [Eubacteriaceae bacterium]MDK2961651.1 hypothetical protein [Eubacteriaceae bacterium]